MGDQDITNTGSIASQINANKSTVNVVYTSPATAPSFFRITAHDSDSVRWQGNTALEQITSLWESSATPPRIEFWASPSQFESLSNAILRLAIHSDSLVLAVPDATQWAQAAGNCVRKYLGADKERWEPCLTASTSGWRLDNISSIPLPSNLTIDTTYPATLLSAQIETRLDDWIIQNLNASLTQALRYGDTSKTNFPIEPDLALQMWTQWEQWRQLLNAKYELRRHFLATMLTTAHNELERRVFGRAGKRTLISCILRPTIFALGIAVAAQQGCTPANKTEAANLVLETRDTHLVGLEVVENKWLRLAWHEIYWKANCILLPHIQADPSLLERMRRKYSDGPASGLSMRRGDLATPTVLTGHLFEECCSQGIEALRTHLRQTLDFLCAEHSELFRQLDLG